MFAADSFSVEHTESYGDRAAEGSHFGLFLLKLHAVFSAYGADIEYLKGRICAFWNDLLLASGLNFRVDLIDRAF